MRAFLLDASDYGLVAADHSPTRDTIETAAIMDRESSLTQVRSQYHNLRRGIFTITANVIFITTKLRAGPIEAHYCTCVRTRDSSSAVCDKNAASTWSARGCRSNGSHENDSRVNCRY